MNRRAYVPRRRAPRFADLERVERVRRGLVSGDGAARLAETFSVLADPTRARILHALSIEELCVGDLAALLELSASNASHQLRLLRSHRLVGVRREGKRSYYRLEDAHIRQLVHMGLSHAEEADGDRTRPGRRFS